MSAFRFGGKLNQFLIKARTGKVQGQRRWSVWKISAAFLAGLVVIGVMVVLFSR